MEQATLRPVPLRPSGPVDPAEALAHVAASLPELDERAARALSLVEIAGRTRDAAGEETGLAAEDLALALYRARKALRRSMFPLSASGWCERAERLLSDRIDGVLAPPGPARLDVHLRNCERCVEHERRLGQARDRLVRAYIDAHPESMAGPAERPRAAELRVVEPQATAPAIEDEPAVEIWTGPTRVVAGFGGPVAERVRDGDTGDPPHPSFAGPGGQADYAPVERRAETEQPEPDVPADPPNEATISPAEPADATPSEHDAETADPIVPSVEEEAAIDIEPDPAAALAPAPVAADAVATRIRLSAGQHLWNGLIAVSIALALLALVLTALAIAGVELHVG